MVSLGILGRIHCQYGVYTGSMANNSLVLTTPARRSFKIIARHKGFVCCFGFVLPVRARLRPHKLGVRHI